MSVKNETLILTATSAIALAILGGGWWWLSENTNLISVNQNLSSTPTTVFDPKSLPSGLFSYGGSTTWAPLRTEITNFIQSNAPQFQLRYTDPVNEAPSSKTGVNMLLNNQLDFSLTSSPLGDEDYERAKTRGTRLKEIPVAIDGIAIAVHPSLNIKGLTLAQFDDIYKTRKITNWKQVGGPDLPIHAYGKKGRDDQPHIIQTSTTTEALRGVSNDRGGIYWASAPLLVPQCMVKTIPIGRSLEQLVTPYQLPFAPPEKCTNTYHNQVNIQAFRSGEYPWTRRLFVVINENGQSQQKAGEAFANLLLSSQGKELITKAGFVSLQ